ncbi:hypothetical protein DRF65_07400 [Chryseobacterium pennae]|uniref:Uncharacterized protein n=1 Tax=Chryseobacterium pennae TaxID=2258962 RepID=A0A3D9CB18_9FLAO|nr:hypothetical protein [Chryseobacterium pennae]REC63045.1 hypothetical protein DRF65_07400 [Chryseobacterium pennae]
MIKTNILTKYTHHTIIDNDKNIYVADYTNQTNHLPIKRSVEIFSPTPPTDISYFTILNNSNLMISTIVFDNNSFTHTNGNSKSQCESSSFPNISNRKSWILFTELKYSSNPLNNQKNLEKAIKQLFRTRYHYIQSGVFNKKENTSYLLASLPEQREPFANFSLSPTYVLNLKNKHNIILRQKNSIEVIDESIIII